MEITHNENLNKQAYICAEAMTHGLTHGDFENIPLVAILHSHKSR